MAQPANSYKYEKKSREHIKLEIRTHQRFNKESKTKALAYISESEYVNSVMSG